MALFQRQTTRKLKILLAVLCLVLFLYIEYPNKSNTKLKFDRDLWSEPCPSWNPKMKQYGSVESADVSADALSSLTMQLKERLDKVNDVVFPDYSKSCDLRPASFNACTTVGCGDRISPKLEHRVKDILTSPDLQLTDKHREAINAFSELFPENEVLLVTATSSDHFGETQKLFKTLHDVVFPKLKNFSAVIVDIGLTDEEVEKARKGCRCKVVKFPHHLFPEHVGVNTCYSFKPLSVIAAMQKASKMLVWQDSSIRWTEGFFHIFERTERIGTQVIRYQGEPRVTAHTLRQPFDYMKREVCAFTKFPEIEACAQFHRKDPVSLKLILEPWAKCALERCCICPVSPKPVLPCVSSVTQHRCHRFDQSALTLGLARLLEDDFQKFVMPDFFKGEPILYKKGGDEMHDYF